MEEEMKFLFRLSHPVELRNLSADELFSTIWNELGLNNISGLNKNLENFNPHQSFAFRASHLNTSYLINALRLSIDCPFVDVRLKAYDVLDYYKNVGVSVPVPVFDCPSKFVPKAECPKFDIEHISLTGSQADLTISGLEKLESVSSPGFFNYSSIPVDKATRLLADAFLSSGRMEHTIQLMAYHPDYLECFLHTQNSLLRGDGPLPFEFRHYIAMMAAARHQCSYLIELQKREFLYRGGDPLWLRGLEAAPVKLTVLSHINKLMAHRPWVLKKEDFYYLTKNAGWSLSEVVHAVVLLAHFHSLSSFVHGCGVTPEIDCYNGHLCLDFVSLSTWSSASPTAVSIESCCGSTDEINTNITSFLASSVHNQCLSTSMTGNVKTVSTNLKAKMPNQVNSSCDDSFQMYKNSSTKHSSDDDLNINTFEVSKNCPHNKIGVSEAVLIEPVEVGGKYLCSDRISEVDVIMETMKHLSKTSPIRDPEEKKKRFETVATSDVENNSQEKGNRNLVIGAENTTAAHPEIHPFMDDPTFSYQDFAKRGQVSELHTFRIQDYSWEEHGFSLVNRLYADSGTYLDEKFKVAKSMTYYTMGGRSDVDTSKFRTAIWNYIQCLYGIRHDDYDYGEVNQLLERPLKYYIKTVCCFPERVTIDDYINVMREFKQSEKVHVILMIMEAKIQAELLYSLRTLMEFIL